MLLPAKLAGALTCLKELAEPGNAAAVQAEFTQLELALLPADKAADMPALTQRTQAEGASAVFVNNRQCGLGDA